MLPPSQSEEDEEQQRCSRTDGYGSPEAQVRASGEMHKEWRRPTCWSTISRARVQRATTSEEHFFRNVTIAVKWHPRGWALLPLESSESGLLDTFRPIWPFWPIQGALAYTSVRTGRDVQEWPEWSFLDICHLRIHPRIEKRVLFDVKLRK